MALEEAVDYAKTLFEELKFIELFVYFCKAPDDVPKAKGDENDGTEAGKEKEYSSYISIDKISYLNDIVCALPLICKKDKNASTAIYSALNTGKEKKEKIAQIEEREKQKKVHHATNDPYIQKLCELIYVNVSKRFQVFGNSFCYLDFKGR